MKQALADWLALALTPGVGPVGFLRLINTFGDASSVLRASASQLERLISSGAREALLSKKYEAALNAAKDWVEQKNCSLMTLLDDDYPEALANISQPPPLLFLRGNRQLFSNPMLAIVGSRMATPPAIKIAKDFAVQLSAIGYSIVSGLAAGVDAAAHQGALASEASTISVIGTGIDRVYPASNQDLARQIAEKGLVVSEFPLGMRPLAGNFPRRNRVIAGLAQGCLVVEASLSSGSLITARISMENGKEVFAIPGSINNPQVAGCHRLIKDGAKLTENIDDILSELTAPILLPRSDKNISYSRLNKKDASEQINDPILKALGHDPLDIDSLSASIGLTLPEVYAMLLELELSGKVACLPGGRYQRLP